MAIHAMSSSRTLVAAGKLNPQGEDIPGVKTVGPKPRDIRVTPLTKLPAREEGPNALATFCSLSFYVALSLSARVEKRTPGPRLLTSSLSVKHCLYCI
jgi:hypothetical protein